MSVFTSQRKIIRNRITDEEAIVCPMCGKELELFNIYSKKHSKDLMYSRFEGSIAECNHCIVDGNCLVFYSYDIAHVREKVKRFDASK